MFCRWLFVLLYFFFWSLCCLFFFDVRILIAPLVSSNSSFIIDYLSYEHNFSYIDWLLVICMDNLIEATSCIVFPKLGTGEDFKSWIHGVVKYFLRSRIGDALTVNQVCQVIIEKGWTSWIPLRGWGNDYKCVFINLMYRYIYIYRVYIVKKRKYFYGMTFFPRWRRTSQICCYSTKR
jgi:hypothetical protein